MTYGESADNDVRVEAVEVAEGRTRGIVRFTDEAVEVQVSTPAVTTS